LALIQPFNPSRTHGRIRLAATRSAPMGRRSTPQLRSRTARVLALAIGLPIAATACRDTPLAFGPNPAAAHERGDALLTSWQDRFTNVERSAAFANARAILGRAALTPGHAYDDSSLWTAMPPGGPHSISINGHFADTHYILAVVPDAPPPSHLADARHVVRLTQLAHNEYEWSTSVEQTLGTITPNDLDRVAGSMLADAATTPGPALAAQSRSTFPHATAALGKMFSLDSVTTTPHDDGSASIHLAYGIHANTLQPTYPAYAAYLRKYVSPARVRFSLSDAAASTWFDLLLDHDEITINLRATRDGHFAPLTGPIRPMPDSLELLSDVHGKVWIFSVGMTELLADFTVLHSPHERGWDLRFHHDPHWHLPLFADHFVKSPLRRPFAGDGATYRLTVHDSTGAQTVLTRAARITVQESTIMRWLGGLGATAMGDFAGPSDAQESAFFVEALAALRADLDAALHATPGLPAADSSH
jgi:hypothetical protein